MSSYTAEQMEKRNNSKWTLVQTILAPLQLLTFIVSAGLIIHYLSTGQGYDIANFSVLVKIALLWLITVTGMFWEKEVFGHWFMAPEFFWEDAFNAVAMFAHNLYFVAILLGWDERSLMILMLAAYSTYIVNFGQFAWRGYKSHQQRVTERAAGQGA
jgi:3-vinyl bacteriochlorophyllide hydratase